MCEIPNSNILSNILNILLETKLAFFKLKKKSQLRLNTIMWS